MYKTFIKNNNLSVSIILFLLLFALFIYTKPSFLFNKNGLIRQFGLGKSNSTILPIWLLVIIISIVSYLAILYYLC
jgi:hypothetical protein